MPCAFPSQPPYPAHVHSHRNAIGVTEQHSPSSEHTWSDDLWQEGKWVFSVPHRQPMTTSWQNSMHSEPCSESSRFRIVHNIFLSFSLFCFVLKTGSHSLCISGSFETHYADQAGLELTETCLPLPPGARATAARSTTYF